MGVFVQLLILDFIIELSYIYLYIEMNETHSAWIWKMQMLIFYYHNKKIDFDKFIHLKKIDLNRSCQYGRDEFLQNSCLWGEKQMLQGLWLACLKKLCI